MSRFLINGRFLMRAPTGVDRVATELIAATLDQGIPSRFKDFSAVRPQGDIVHPEERPKDLRLITSPTESTLSGHIWEQWTLARTDPKAWLISLCNMGPVLRKRQVVMLHDAQAFRQPDAYSANFRRFYHFMQPRLGHRAQTVLTVSEHSKRELEHFGVVPANKAIVIHNGADHILRTEADQGTLARHGLSAGNYFLAIGSLAPHKNLKMLIAAAEARANRDIPLVIAGGGNSTVFAESGLQGSDTVKLLGRVSDPELRALYENATALLFPSITEGFGLPPAEAMTLGCPVIASTGGAIPEVTGSAAISLDPMDQQEWTTAMEKLGGNTSHLRDLSERGRERAKQFTWARAAEKFMQILEDLPDS